MIIRKLVCSTFLAVVLGTGASQVLAQRQTDGNQTGLPPFGTFHGSNFDVVSLQNGNLHIEIPIASLKQRGGRTFTWSFIYDTPTWEVVWNPLPPPPDNNGVWTVIPAEEDSGWRLNNSVGSWGISYTATESECPQSASQGPLPYTYWTNFTVWEPNGTKHPLPLRKLSSTVGCDGETLSGPALDGTGIWVDITNWPIATITLKDGTQVAPSWRDSNGNTAGPSSDMMGRILVNRIVGPMTTCAIPGGGSTPCPQYEDWVVRDSAGGSQTYRLTYTAREVATSFCGAPVSGTCFENAGPSLFPATLTLPNNKSYLFSWASSGYPDLTRIDLPTGGYIEYSYAKFITRPGDSGHYGTWNARRKVTQRRVYDGSATRFWDYYITTGGSTVTDPLGNKESRVYGGIGIGSDRSYETGIGYYQCPPPRDPNPPSASCALVKSVTKDYSAETNPVTGKAANARVIRETTTLENGLTTKVETDFETFTYANVGPFTCPGGSCVATRLNATEKREYAFDPGAAGGLTRKTTFSYRHTGNPTYTNLNIVDRMASSVTYDGAGNIVAQSQNEYDNYTEAIFSTGAMNHDSAFGSGYTARGNATATKRWRNTDGAWLTTRNQYDDVGNIIKSTDPLGHNSYFDYSDAWANTTCAPAGSGRIYLKESKNHLNHRVWNTWNSCTGTLASSRDENDILAGRAGTTYTYDFMDRVDITNAPDGGQTDNDYDDTNRIVTTKVKKDASSFIASRAHYDLLGRVWRTEQCEDGPTCSQVIRTDTTFDALGRKETVTNPYRPGVSAPTDGITRFCYDALGRTLTVTPPDGTAPDANCNGGANLVRTSYAGNVTTVTDQAGKQRRSYTDALGRLIQVDEPGGGGPATGSSGSATVNSVNPSGGVQEQNISAIAALGSVTLSGGVQSTQSQIASATQSAGSITVNGAEQSAQVQTAAATPGTGSVTFGAANAPVWTSYEVWGCVWYDESGGCMEEGWVEEWGWVYDTGYVSVDVNGYAKGVNYYSSNTPAQIAGAIASAMNADPNFPAWADWYGGDTIYFTSKTVGSSSNYFVGGNSYSYSPQYFDPPSFFPSLVGLSGGANAQYSTVYDAGTVSATVNGFTAQANFGSSSNTSSIATDLRNVFNTNPSSPVWAGGTGASVTLTSRAAGSGTNYALSVAWTYNSSYFGSPSFTASKSGNNLTGGSDAQYTTVYDSGTVSITVNGVAKSVSYGQGSSTATIASALATAIANDGTYPATASANGATVNLTARTAGAVGNGYSLNASATWNTSYFGSPSFAASKSGDYLSGGVDGSVAYDAGTVTLTIAGCTPFTVNYANGSTRDTVAEALRAAVAGSGCPVQIARTGNVLSLQSSTVGSGVNYTLSSSNSTTQGQYFAAPSFSVAVSGMSGGADYTPGTLSTPLITAYTYDALDNLTCVEQRGNVSGTGCSSAPVNDASSPWRVRRFSYNSLSQLREAKNPESGTINYSYDADGNVETKTSPAPNQTNPAVTQTMSYCYDELHRLTKKAYTTGGCSVLAPAAQYFYDQTSYNGLTIANGKGQRTGMSDGSGQTAWSYDIVANTGWKTTERRTLNGVTKTVISQNNLAGGTQYVTYPSTQTVNYTFDTAGRAISAQGSLTQYADSATYAPHSALATLNNGGIFGGGINSTYFYNNRLQPCRISVRTTGSAPTDCASSTTGNVLDFRYSFDSDPGAGVANNGNVAKIENLLNTNRTQSFSYDELNRIRTATTQATTGTHAWGYSFAYDPWANLHPATITQGDPSPVGASPATDNRILGYCYDAAGNLLIPGACGGLVNLTYTYDAENRIVTTGGVTYTYDGDGKRVKKSNGKLYWTGMGSDPLAESDLAGNISEEYIFFNGKRVARRVLSTGAVFYYFGDHLGTSRVILQSGATTPCYDADYYPFGGERVVTDTCPQSYKFTGKERDTESNLDYFGARYYASTSGRYLSPDWSVAPATVPYADFDNPQSLNLYTYVGNNPIMLTDPDGHCWPLSVCADKLDAFVQTFRQDGAAANSKTASPGLAALNTFANGVTADLAVGATNLLRVGESIGAKLDSGSISQQALAAVEDGGRAGGLALLGVSLATPRPTPNSVGAQGEVAVASQIKASPGTYAPPEPLPRNKVTGNPVPESPYPHTQLGTRQSKSQPGTSYTEAREFGQNGQHVKDIHFTDHGRANHPNPHQHVITRQSGSNTGKRGPAEPLKP